jgi:hypothetical protein
VLRDSGCLTAGGETAGASPRPRADDGQGWRGRPTEAGHRGGGAAYRRGGDKSDSEEDSDNRPRAAAQGHAL